MAVRITCIHKSGGYHENPHEAISDFGWINEATNATGKRYFSGNGEIPRRGQRPSLRG